MFIIQPLKEKKKSMDWLHDGRREGKTSVYTPLTVSVKECRQGTQQHKSSHQEMRSWYSLKCPQLNVSPLLWKRSMDSGSCCAHWIITRTCANRHTNDHRGWTSFFSYCKYIRSGYWKECLSSRWEGLLPQQWKRRSLNFHRDTLASFNLKRKKKLRLLLLLLHTHTHTHAYHVRDWFHFVCLSVIWLDVTCNSHGLLAILMSFIYLYWNQGHVSLTLTGITWHVFNPLPHVHLLLLHLGV